MLKFNPAKPHKTLWSPNTSGVRPTSDILYGVVHCTADTNSAAADAAYFHTPNTASTHTLHDNKETWRTVPDRGICWGAASGTHGANQHGLHSEICGEEYWTRDQWLQYRLKAIKRAAYQHAVWSLKYHYPAIWLSANDLKLGKRGITTHRAISEAWSPGGHSDPGPNDGKHFPYDKFMWWVREYRREIWKKNH